MLLLVGPMSGGGQGKSQDPTEACRSGRGWEPAYDAEKWCHLAVLWGGGGAGGGVVLFFTKAQTHLS